MEFLRIKKGIDLKKLEKFGAEIYDEQVIFDNGFENLEFYGKDLQLFNGTAYGSLWLSKLYDLIKADIVEKAVE